MKLKKPYFIVYIIIFVAIFFVDRVLKNIVTANMQIGESIPSADAFFRIHFITNDGVAFSLLQGNPEALIVLQSLFFVCILIAIVTIYRKYYHPALMVALTFIIAGGAGNLVDRILYQYVIDFISVGNFPVWNFADMSIVGGCILLAIYILFIQGNEKSRGGVADEQ